MAKKAYVGVNNVARKIKSGYVGVRTAFPIYQTQTTTETVNIVGSNISSYFETTFDYFAWLDTRFQSNNGGVANSTALAILTALQDCTVTYTYNYGTETNYDKFTLKVNDTTIHDNVSGAGTATTRTDTLTKGQQIVFKYTKDSSVDNNGDYIAFYNMSATITTTKEVQVGTNYRNIARRIKKAYIGIGGVARPCWSSGELAYYGTATELSVGRYDLAATAVGDYALFGGGYDSNDVDAYDKSLTHTIPRGLLVSRYGLAATTVGDYALFGGGSDGKDYQSTVDAYDRSLTHTKPTDLSVSRSSLAATAVGDYALFGGGMGLPGSKTTVNAYDKSLTHTIPTELSEPRYDLAATAVGDHALFGGGGINNYNNIVDAYDKSLTRTTLEDLSGGRYALAATTVGDYALFGGGVYSGSYKTTVDAYDKSLTHTIPTELSAPRYDLAATAVGDYALFGGGRGASYTNIVDVYDKSLTRTNPLGLSVGRYDLASTAIGDYALFGGGRGASYTNIVDVYMID